MPLLLSHHERFWLGYYCTFGKMDRQSSSTQRNLGLKYELESSDHVVFIVKSIHILFKEK